jgi:ribosomal protein L21
MAKRVTWFLTKVLLAGAMKTSASESYLENAKVPAVSGHRKNRKVVVFKYKRRIFRKTRGTGKSTR